MSSSGKSGGALPADPLTVAHGGIGVATVAAHGVMIGEGASATAATAAGATGTVLQGQGNAADPTFGVLPGTLLASQLYHPALLSTYVVPATTITPLDTTNLTLAFTVPANGIVDVVVEALMQVATGAVSNAFVFAALTNHAGGAIVGDALYAIATSAVSQAQTVSTQLRWHLTGLAAGALQLDFAAGRNSPAGASANVYAQAASSLTVATVAGDGGPFLMQAFAGA